MFVYGGSILIIIIICNIEYKNYIGVIFYKNIIVFL